MATENVLATQLTIGMMGAGLLAWLKNRAWLPFINQHSAVINHVILVVTSAAGALGVHMAWNASAHSLTIMGLDAASIAAGMWVWAKQWTVQFLVHRGAFGQVSTSAPPPAVPIPIKP